MRENDLYGRTLRVLRPWSGEDVGLGSDPLTTARFTLTQGGVHQNRDETGLPPIDRCARGEAEAALSRGTARTSAGCKLN